MNTGNGGFLWSGRPEVAPQDDSMALVPGVVVGGYVPLTTIDFPGRLAAVVFLQGCPWSCPYCHNPELRSFSRKAALGWPEVVARLQRRRALLDGVVFSGGEPTAHSGLPDAMQQVRALGFAVGLHTAGAYPEHLARALPWVDWVGLDVKAPPDARYERLCGCQGAGQRFLRSLELVRNSGVEFTLRTTVHPNWLSAQDWQELLAWAEQAGLPPPVRQEAQPAKKNGTKVQLRKQSALIPHDEKGTTWMTT